MIFSNSVSWFEIPTIDIDRAQKFYEAIFDIEMVQMDNPKIKMRMFPVESMQSITGALVYNAEFYTPSDKDGALIYLNANPDVQIVLDRVEGAGGKILVPKTEIAPDYGFMAIFMDTEGNRVGLHSVPVNKS